MQIVCDKCCHRTVCKLENEYRARKDKPDEHYWLPPQLICPYFYPINKESDSAIMETRNVRQGIEIIAREVFAEEIKRVAVSIKPTFGLNKYPEIKLIYPNES